MTDKRRGPQQQDRKPRYSPEELRARALARTRKHQAKANAKKRARKLERTGSRVKFSCKASVSLR